MIGSRGSIGSPKAADRPTFPGMDTGRNEMGYGANFPKRGHFHFARDKRFEIATLHVVYS